MKGYATLNRLYNSKIQSSLMLNWWDVFSAILNTKGIIWLIGNGGSFAVAQHAATDLTKAGKKKALALCNLSSLTAYGNDLSFEDIFSGQLTAFIQRDEFLDGSYCNQDTLIALSTSGESPNILKAVEQANKEKITTIGLTSKNCSLSKMVKILLEFDEKDPKILEDLFQITLHKITQLLEEIHDNNSDPPKD